MTFSIMNQIKKKKRGCVIRHDYYPEEKSVHREVIALSEIGLEIHVICLRGPDQASEEIVDGIHIHRVPLKREKGSIGRYLYDYLSFFLLASIKVTVLHLRYYFAVIQVNTMPDFLIFTTLIPRLLGAKTVIQMHEPTPELWTTMSGSHLLIFLLEFVEQISLNYAQRVFTVTEQLKETYVSRGANPDKISVILNVPDARLFESGDISPIPSGDDFRIICHGAIEERYGQDTIVEAASLVKDVIPGLRIHVLGQGTYVEKFVAQIKALGVQKYVYYLGWVTFSQMVLELRQADVGIIAQKSSPYSNLVHTGKMYDYINFGKAVIASRLTSVRAYFDEDSICFYEAGNAEDLARAILSLYHNPNKRQKLARNAASLYHKNYKWDHQRKIYQDVYRSLIGLGEDDATVY
ncbi:MAG: glycosyltransferase WbuB [Candidatus Scalindua sp. SCAELEC01]|nr:MAG: glycosyltransferase WbuB [Candidatus Scalindua sp. SCAELEC01]